jgi:hypothetical protein
VLGWLPELSTSTYIGQDRSRRFLQGTSVINLESLLRLKVAGLAALLVIDSEGDPVERTMAVFHFWTTGHLHRLVCVTVSSAVTMRLPSSYLLDFFGLLPCHLAVSYAPI